MSEPHVQWTAPSPLWEATVNTTDPAVRQVGLPDRTLDTGHQERATFVVRRLVNPDPTNTTALGDPESCDEYAMVQTARGSVWQQITDATQRQAAVLLPGEEQLPLFAVYFSGDDERKRRLF